MLTRSPPPKNAIFFLLLSFLLFFDPSFFPLLSNFLFRGDVLRYAFNNDDDALDNFFFLFFFLEIISRTEERWCIY